MVLPSNSFLIAFTIDYPFYRGFSNTREACAKLNHLSKKINRRGRSAEQFVLKPTSPEVFRRVNKKRRLNATTRNAPRQRLKGSDLFKKGRTLFKKINSFEKLYSNTIQI